MQSIGERIKYLRKVILDMTQKDFGSKIGLKPNSVSDIESGKNKPTNQTIKAICREFNINEDWLQTEEGEMQSKKSIVWGDICADISANDPKAREAIMKYYELSDEDKKLWWKWMETFLK